MVCWHLAVRLAVPVSGGVYAQNHMYCLFAFAITNVLLSLVDLVKLSALVPLV